VPARQVTDIQYERLMRIFGDGLFGSPLDPAPAYGDSSGRQVKIRANTTGLVRGRMYDSGTTDVTKSVGANAGSTTRIDMLVLQLDRATWKVTAVVKAGGTSPPALQRDLDAAGAGTGKFEIPVALINVSPGAVTITAGDVTPIPWYIAPPELLTTSTAYPYIPVVRGQLMNEVDVGNRFVAESTGWRSIPTIDEVTRLVASKSFSTGAYPYQNKSSWTTIASFTVSVGAGRSYSVELDAAAVTGDGRLPIGYEYRLYDGNTQIGESGVRLLEQVGRPDPIHVAVPLAVATTGNRVVSVQVGRVTGSGSFDVLGSRANPFWFRVYDHGKIDL
jgi:hypothetical protein